MDKLIYRFACGETDGDAAMRELLGGKGASLAEMARIGLPVPPGFTIPTTVCRYFLSHGESFPAGLQTQILQGVQQIEQLLERRFGDRNCPLLLSVRSGAAISMPGMMDTILNLGLTNFTVEGLIDQTHNPRFAYDSYRRLIQMYGAVVAGVDAELFEAQLTAMRDEAGVTHDSDLSVQHIESLVGSFLRTYLEHAGTEFPQDPYEQLWGAVSAVLRSWNNRRAIEYRRIHEISAGGGTACTVQSMVFGNLDETSATGVAFTRDPMNGERQLFGEYLVNAQGEDVVAGVRTPQPIVQQESAVAEQSLEGAMPECFAELSLMRKRLEQHYREMQDIEFTIESGKVWLLQTRDAKRTAQAAIRIAVDMVAEQILSKEEALGRVEAARLEELLHPSLETAGKTPLANGLAASPGGAVGRIVFTADDAVEWAARGESVILIRHETSPEDIHGMNVAQGFLTTRGGLTSHAAVVARGMGKPCVVGCGNVQIDLAQQCVTIGDQVLQQGEALALDGGTGEVFLGECTLHRAEPGPAFDKFMSWADQLRTLRVRANADNARDAQIALDLGAEGIGLARTEHMFFESGRIEFMQEMILAPNAESRQRALNALLPLQREDFHQLLLVMRGRPVTIRLLDPPLHEFLPKTTAEVETLAERAAVSPSVIAQHAHNLREHNPMLGHRGCRLGITSPEIYAMQARAMLEAAAQVSDETGVESVLEIEVPLVAHVNELRRVRDIVDQVSQQVDAQVGRHVPYLLGAMLELPRACVAADSLAECADFLSFGTNDLTQTCFGLSRDDAARFLQQYVDQEIVLWNPFGHLDTEGVGGLMVLAVERARRVKPSLPIGICGEHGGDPQSIRFCNNLGLQYVSCSPYRIPVARLAAAQASIAK